jgi:membrane protein
MQRTRQAGESGGGSGRAQPSMAQFLLGLGVAWLALNNRRGRQGPHAHPTLPARGGDSVSGRAAAVANHPTPGRNQAGQTAGRPTDIPARGWMEVMRRVWNEISKDNMSIVAAGCAFYAMLALFPAVTALVSIYGLVADPGEIEQQVNTMRGVLPEEAVGLVANQAHQVAAGATGTLGWSAALALLLALWSASAGVKTLFTALNIAYEEKETRGLVRFNLTALLFTLGAIVAVVVGLGVIIGVPAVMEYLPLGPLGQWLVRITSWLVLVVLLIIGLAMIYRFGPSRAPANWRWLSPGASVATLLWLLASAAFSYYVANFASYNQTYGALGGVIILLMWLYISAFVILLGAELNAELELQTAEDTTTGAPEPMGRRRAFAADHVAAPRPT